MLTEVLKERDAQVEFNELKKVALAGQDRAYLELAQRELEDSIRKDQESALTRIGAARNNAEFLKAQ